MKCFFKLSITGTFTILAAGAIGQSINADLDLATDPPLGGGVPSDTFAGAGLAGHWHKLHASGWVDNEFFRDINGTLTSARILNSFGGLGGGWNLPQNTGDYAALLNDARYVGFQGDHVTFHFVGLLPGTYTLSTYAVRPSLVGASSSVRISSSRATNGPQIAQGVMPGNQLIPGLTHTTHQLNITNGELDLTFDCLAGHAYWNGFQLVYHTVPEPASVTILAPLALFYMRRRNKIS